MVPNSKYKVDTITYSDTSDVIFENNKLVITNVSNDVVVDVKFKEEKTSVNKPEIIPITKPEVSPVPDDDKNNNIENSGNNDTNGTEGFKVFNYGKGQVLINIPKLNEFEFVTIPDTEAFIKTVFTQEELEVIADGNKMEVHFIPTIYEKVEQVPIKDKTLIDRFLQINSQEKHNLMVGVYVDIKLYKVTNSGEMINVIRTEKPIEMVFNIPEGIDFEGAKYSVICSHEGKIILLEDLDNNENTITINAQYFSTYAILYSLSRDNAKYLFWIILGLNLLGIIVYIILKNKKQNNI